MSDLRCKATISSETIDLGFPEKNISISLDEDIDFTPLVKYLTELIEKDCKINLEWPDASEIGKKGTVAKFVVSKIFNSFNEVTSEVSVGPETVPDLTNSSSVNDDVPF
jgi:hypothetical protein